jgi:hypothetical protein
MPTSRCWRKRSRVWQLLDQAGEVASVGCLAQLVGELQELVAIDPALAVGDFFRAGDLEALAFLDALDEVGGLQQGLGRAGVEPGEAAAELFEVQGALLQVQAVEIGDLELAARGGAYCGARKGLFEINGRYRP